MAPVCPHCGRPMGQPGEVDEIMQAVVAGKRIACPDESCTGIIKENGQCGTCGKHYSWGSTRIEVGEPFSPVEDRWNQITPEKRVPSQATTGGVVGFLILFFIVISMFNSCGEGKKEPPAGPKTATELRQERIQSGFSAWDGSHRALEQIIKKSMNDPESYEHVETRYLDKGDFLIVITKFRGKNAFGGTVVNSAAAKADLNGKVLEIISQGP